MRHCRLLTIAPLAATLICISGSGAAAGDNNRLIVLQETTLGGSQGNSLSVDQSLSDNSLVRGPDGASEPGIQRGDGNALEIDVTGSGSNVIFLQDNSAAVTAQGNTGTITVDGNATASLLQTGDQNLATLNVSGPLTSGSITQDGIGNNGTLTVDGTGASGSVLQDGDENEVAVEVYGAGTTVSYSQNGDSLQATGNAVQVFSNGATVTITQSAIGSP